MAYSKLNVLHWHVTDDQSFPLVLQSFPKLSDAGSYNAGHPTHVYSLHDVQTILDAATERGIRVIPELDMPGHTHSWFKGHPELATSCPGIAGGFGIPMNPISPVVDAFVRTLWHEVNGLFPDKYVHIGGDEVNGACWGGNATIRAYMKQHFGNESDYGALGLDQLHDGDVPARPRRRRAALEPARHAERHRRGGARRLAPLPPPRARAQHPAGEQRRLGRRRARRRLLPHAVRPAVCAAVLACRGSL
jgi:hypothetical protein